MILVVGIWERRVKPESYAPVVREIRQRFGGRPLGMYPYVNPSLCWESRDTFPVYTDVASARDALRSTPGLIIMAEQRPSKPTPDFGTFPRLYRIELEEKHLDFYGEP